MAGVRKKLRQVIEQHVPDEILEERDIRDVTSSYLEAKTDWDREEAWGSLEDAVRRALYFWNVGREEGLRGVQSGTRGSSRDMREAEERDGGEDSGLDPREFASNRTRAMTEAMSAFFAVVADQISEVKEFRERILPSRFLSPDEAHALIASYAARILDLRLFEKWSIPFVGHDSELLEHVTSSDRGGVYIRATVRVDPPGITKTVRYVDRYNLFLAKEDVADSRVLERHDSAVPLVTGLPVTMNAPHTCPSWLWPGSVVDTLYDLSVVLASAFDWPLASDGNLWGTRPKSDSAAWFILTGEVPQVRPMEARWEMSHGSKLLGPQWRMHLKIPPWLPEEEIVQAVRTLRKQRPAGRQMPKSEKPLEVARFVYERERLDGFSEPAPWTALLKRWNDEHPGHRFKTASNFRTYFLRGDAAVKRLNFDRPTF
jgi:hypothetical protein